MPNKLIPYNPALKEKARLLRKAGVLSEVLLWQEIKNKKTGFEFHRQVPMLEYIVGFYCHELMLVIEIDGHSHSIEETAIRDITRQKEIEAYGITFLRIDDLDVKKNMTGVLISIQNMIEQLVSSK